MLIYLHICPLCEDNPLWQQVRHLQGVVSPTWCSDEAFLGAALGVPLSDGVPDLERQLQYPSRCAKTTQILNWRATLTEPNTEMQMRPAMVDKRFCSRFEGLVGNLATPLPKFPAR